MVEAKRLADFSKLWCLDSPHPHEVRLDLVEPAGFREVREVARGQIPPPQPCVFRVCGGHIAYTELSTNTIHLRVFNQRFFDVLADAGLTGWDSYPVEITKLPARCTEKDYRGLIIRGRCGALDYSLSRPATELALPPAKNPVPALIGSYFDPTSWDGSDVFMHKNTLILMLSQKAKEVLDGAGLRGLRLTRLDQYIHPDLPSFHR